MRLRWACQWPLPYYSLETFRIGAESEPLIVFFNVTGHQLVLLSVRNQSACLLSFLPACQRYSCVAQEGTRVDQART